MIRKIPCCPNEKGIQVSGLASLLSLWTNHSIIHSAYFILAHLCPKVKLDQIAVSKRLYMVLYLQSIQSHFTLDHQIDPDYAGISVYLKLFPAPHSDYYTKILPKSSSRDGPQ